jgi:hypothetical protein
VHALPRGHGLDVARDGAHGRRAIQRERSARDRHAARRHQAGRGPHDLRAGRCGGVWPVQGLIRHFRPDELQTAHRRIQGARTASATSHRVVSALCLRGGVSAFPDQQECVRTRSGWTQGQSVMSTASRSRFRRRHAAGLRGGGRGDSALLLPRAAVDRRQLPHVPGRGEGRAEAGRVLRLGVRDAPRPERRAAGLHPDTPLVRRRAKA